MWVRVSRMAEIVSSEVERLMIRDLIDESVLKESVSPPERVALSFSSVSRHSRCPIMSCERRRQPAPEF